MKKIIILICPLFLLLFSTSCATIFNGTKSKVNVSASNYNGRANIIVDGKSYNNVSLPHKVKVKNGYKTSNITVRADGYEDANISVKKRFNRTSIWNIFTSFGAGFIVDAATGAIKKPENKSYTVYMKSLKEETPEPAPIQQPIQVIINNETKKEDTPVSRDNPGATDLEKTIVRWYFESEPQGSRIFWRVISSVPDQVKNTNELWLGTTPFEETRSFNIQGLTYENANNVQIEIKVRKSGYIDQTKRFNVRQAIDQQEISSFFDMVKKDVE